MSHTTTLDSMELMGLAVPEVPLPIIVATSVAPMDPTYMAPMHPVAPTAPMTLMIQRGLVIPVAPKVFLARMDLMALMSTVVPTAAMAPVPVIGLNGSYGA